MQTVYRRSARTDDRVDPAILDADCNAVLDTIETGGPSRGGHRRDIYCQGAELQQALRHFRQPVDVA